MVLIVAILGAAWAIYKILTSDAFLYAQPTEQELWPTRNRDTSWDHEPNCRCRTCRE